MTSFKSTGSTTHASELHHALPDLPCDAEGPVFAAPWEAQAFAMVLALHERGAFTWVEWAATLAQAIRDEEAVHGPDNGEQYYHHWLVALERITAEKGLVTHHTLAQRKEEWRVAALHTPHGQPVELKPAG